MTVTLTQEVAEAIDGALYESGFEALGNTDNGAVDWWTRSGAERHKILRVSVSRSSLEFVMVGAEWPVITPGGVMRGSTTWTIPCNGTQTRDKAIDASVEVVVKVLELFKDVLEGTGLANAAAVPVASEVEE